jgi:hypothetical protein
VWKWAAASRRGTSHEKDGSRLQDAFRCFTAGSENEYLVAIVSDGAGSAKFGGQGASLVCRTIGNLARRHLITQDRLPLDEEVSGWTDDVRDLLASVAQRRGLALRDFAATLVCLISDGKDSVVGHVGDGCVVIKRTAPEDWFAASWPEQGEYASTTFFMTDEAELRLRITRSDEQIQAAALFSDGLERLALDFSIRAPSPRFFEPMIAPVTASVRAGKNSELSAALKQYLASPAVIARTDDDKTLVLAARQ